MYIKWIPTEEVDKIYLPDTFQMNQQACKDKIRFQFGSWNKVLSVKKTEYLPTNTIGLSENIKNEVFIPDDLLFVINVTEESISLGPVILYLISKQLLARREKVIERLKKFTPINGLIIICSVVGINKEKEIIEGFYFHPGLLEEKPTLREGIFRYPGVIFKRVPLPSSLNKHLYDRVSGNIFNSKFFNKWDMWQWLSPDLSIKEHLPYTKELSTLNEITEMLESYKTVYLKPKSGSRGKGIIQVKHEKDSYQIIDDKNKMTTAIHLDQHPLMKRLLKKKKGDYMIQQGVPVQHDSRNVDFRIYMQKDITHQWKCTGLIARLAKPGSITTNLSHVDYLLKGTEAFNQIYELDQSEGEKLLQKIIDTCIKACELLDQQGHFADIAIDFILDSQLHVWILEMNKRYGYKSFSLIEDSELHKKIIQNPFLYASALTGFSTANKTT